MSLGLTLDTPKELGLALEDIETQVYREDEPPFGLELGEPRIELTIRIKMGGSPYFFTPEKELMGRVIEGFKVISISSHPGYRDVVLLEEK